jgi:hypothetical protein
MQINPAEEWQQLIEHYREMFDGELEDLASNMDDLTETAREVLRNEMKNRGLAMPGEKAGVAFNPGHGSAGLASSAAPHTQAATTDGASSENPDDSPRDYTWKTPLCECESAGEAWEIHKALRSAGIDSWVEEAGRTYRFNSRVVVAADQLEQAQAIAARPIPQEIIEEYNQEVPEYVLPKCPKCGVEDPVLESAEPTNSWLCEACGAQWTDPETEAGGNPA